MWSNKICQQRLLYEKWEWMIDRIVLNVWLNWHWKLLERKKKERVWMRSYYVCLVELVEWFLMSSNPMFVYKYGLLQNTSDKKTTHAHENCLHPLLFIHSPSLYHWCIHQSHPHWDPKPNTLLSHILLSFHLPAASSLLIPDASSFPRHHFGSLHSRESQEFLWLLVCSMEVLEECSHEPV